MKKLAASFHELAVYQLAFELQQEVYRCVKKWPTPERYALTDQILRSSRSIGANLAEAWSKRIYPAHFLSKLTDCDGELQETIHWLRTAAECGFLAQDQYACFRKRYAELGRMLGTMIRKHDQFTR